MGVCPPRMEIQRREGMCVCETHNGIQKDKASSISNFKRTIKSISYDMQDTSTRNLARPTNLDKTHPFESDTYKYVNRFYLKKFMGDVAEHTPFDKN